MQRSRLFSWRTPRRACFVFRTDTNPGTNRLNLDVYYNITVVNAGGFSSGTIGRLSASINAVTQAWLANNPSVGYAAAPLYWIKDMPTFGSKLTIDISTLIGNNTLSTSLPLNFVACFPHPALCGYSWPSPVPQFPFPTLFY